MSALTERTRWWGWGGEEGRARLPEHAYGLLEDQIGLPPRAAPPAAPELEAVSLPEGALPAAVRERLATIVGEEHVREDRGARVAHAAGKSYPDLLRLRAGEAPAAPDAVLEPGSAAEVAAALEVLAAARVAVVPFGGGTSVVGGVTPDRGGFEAALSIDTGRLDQVREVDRRSLTAVVQAGAVGARRRGRARAPGPDPRPLPPVLRARHRRRLRGHPLGGPGLDRLRAHRGERARSADADAGRGAGHARRCRPPPPAPPCASWPWARRACSG